MGEGTIACGLGTCGGLATTEAAPQQPVRTFFNLVVYIVLIVCLLSWFEAERKQAERNAASQPVGVPGVSQQDATTSAAAAAAAAAAQQQVQYILKRHMLPRVTHVHGSLNTYSVAHSSRTLPPNSVCHCHPHNDYVDSRYFASCTYRA
jgi:hypothetical protein